MRRFLKVLHKSDCLWIKLVCVDPWKHFSNNLKKVSSFIFIRSIHKNITSELKKWKSYSKKENSSQSRNHWARIQWDTSFWPATDSSWNNDISCDAFASKYPRGKLWLLITFVKMAAFNMMPTRLSNAMLCMISF